MKILRLNIRGLRELNKWRYLRDVIRKENIKMVCFTGK